MIKTCPADESTGSTGESTICESDCLNDEECAEGQLCCSVGCNRRCLAANISKYNRITKIITRNWVIN